MSDDQKISRSPWTASASGGGGVKKPAPRRSGEGIIVGIILIFLVIGGYGLYQLFFSPTGQPASSKISIEFSKPDQILIGEPFTVTVNVSNYSDNVLKNADISLLLPTGVYFVGEPDSKRLSDQAIGDLGPGSVKPQEFNLIALTGDATRRLEAKLTYAFSQTSGAQYESMGNLDLLINQAAVAINLGLPQSVFSGQDFDITVSYSNNTTHDFKDASLALDYPPTFTFKKSSVSADGQGNNSWKLGDIPAGSAGTITITGAVVAPEGSFFDVGASLSSAVSGSTYEIGKQTATLAISQSPLSVTITANGSSDYVSHTGDTITYKIQYQNNSDMAMQNVKIQATPTGELFQPSGISTNGNFNSLTNTITWFPATNQELSSVPSKQGGTVSFSIPVAGSFPIRLLSDKNYTLKVQAQVESPTVPQNITADKTVSIGTIVSKVAGKLDFVSEAYWGDAASGILNNGPYPPRVNQPTQFTVHWRIVNYATDVNTVHLSAYLQSGARFTGVAKSTVDTSPVYNPNSGLVTWDIPSIAATKGFISPPAEAIFQIEVTPASNQVGSAVVFLGDTSIQWTDSFVGQTGQGTAKALDTSVPNDKTFTGGDRRVQP